LLIFFIAQTPDDRFSVVADFSRLLPSMAEGASNTNKALEKSLELMISIFTKRISLDSEDVPCTPCCTPDHYDLTIDDISSWKEVDKQEQEQVLLSIGMPYDDDSHLDRQRQIPKIGHLDMVNAMEEMLMDMVNHLEYAASLHIPSVTWESYGSISVTCASRLSRVLQRLQSMEDTTSLNLSLSDNDHQQNDLSATLKLLASLWMINQWVYGETMKLQAKFDDGVTMTRIRLVAAISSTLARVIDFTKTNYSLFRENVYALRKQIFFSKRLYHMLRCSDTCYNDSSLRCNDEMPNDIVNGEDLDHQLSNCVDYERHSLDQYIQNMKDMKGETVTLKDGLRQSVANLVVEVDGWIQECNTHYAEIETTWNDDAPITLNEVTFEKSGSLERHLSNIISAMERLQDQCLQASGQASHFDLLRRLRESRIKIMDMEPRLDLTKKRMQVLEKYQSWEGLYSSIMLKIVDADEHIDSMLEERDIWAAKVENGYVDENCSTLLQQESSLESLMHDMGLENVSEAFDDFEETAASTILRLPNRMYERQQSLLSEFMRLQSRLQFTISISQQQSQVGEIQRHVVELRHTCNQLQQSSLQQLSIERLEELCTQLVSTMVRGHTSVHYPESLADDLVRRNSRVNQQVRSGIGTLQLSLISMLDELKSLIERCQRQREVQKTIEQIKVIAGRHRRLLQSRITSFEQSPVNLNARMSLQDLNEIDKSTYNLQDLTEQPFSMCTKSQMTLLQSSEEGRAIYHTQMQDISKLVEHLMSIQQKRHVSLDIMRFRSIWEYRYQDCATSLGAIIEKLPIIMRWIWRFHNKDVDFEPINLVDLTSGSLTDQMSKEQLAYDMFKKHYNDLSEAGTEDITVILADAGHRHENLAQMAEVVALVEVIHKDRLEQRSHVQHLRDIHSDLTQQLNELHERLQGAISQEDSDDTPCFASDIEDVQSKLKDFDDWCLDSALYPDCQQHTLLPHDYILELIQCNEDVRYYVNQLQDILCQKFNGIVESNKVYCDVVSLLQEQDEFQDRCNKCQHQVSKFNLDHVLLDDPVPQDLNTTFALVQCLAVQSEMKMLSKFANGLAEKFKALVDRLSKLGWPQTSYISLIIRSSRVCELARALVLALHRTTNATLALQLRQTWETWWNSAKEKLEQCISTLEGSQQFLMEPSARSSSIDSAEQMFRITVQTDVASSNFGFRNVSKAYTCVSQSEGLLPRLQQKHGELRRLVSKVEWLLAKGRGHGEHMHSRARKLSSPNSLETRSRKISLPTRKSSSFNDQLTASRSAVVSSKSSSTRSRPSISSRSGHRNPRQLYIPDPANVLDVEVGRIINESPYQISIKAVPGEVGRYWFGDVQPKLAYCRILKSSMVMVRVGGGWTELTQFLRNHALLEGNFIPRERSLTEDEGLREGFIRTHRANAPLARNSKNRPEQYGIKDGDRFIVGNGIEVKMTRAQDERTVPRSSRPNHLQN
jgi:hypothetical protein